MQYKVDCDQGLCQEFSLSVLKFFRAFVENRVLQKKKALLQKVLWKMVVLF